MKHLVAILVIFVSTTKALKCITCENARSHAECDANGKTVTCRYNELSCAIEERTLNLGPEKLIFKHCKQPNACQNNEIQNPRPAWWPTQCNRKIPNTVCRCCCKEDLCNVGPDKCFNRVSNECSPPHSNPRFGEVTCSKSNEIGSLCSFKCDDGYVISGASTSTCGENGAWSSPAPSCASIRCSRIGGSSARSVDCSKDTFLGSVCRFTCDEGFELIGSQSITCRDDTGGDAIGSWSSLPPTCRQTTCLSPPAAPENGYIACSDFNKIGSVCEFACNDFYARNGSLYTTCVKDGSIPMWNNPTPVCERISCADQGVLPHGETTCADSNFVNSECEFRCTGNQYFLSPSNVTSNVCLNSTSWNQPKPCCARSCPPVALFDMVVIMDSSSSVGDAAWDIMKSFVISVAGLYEVAEDSMAFAIFRYNKLIDELSSIPLTSTSVDKATLLNQINAIPYDGEGTRTGQALTYAREVVLTGTGNRGYAKDVVLLLTDGVSQDEVVEPSKKLRDDGVLVYTVGIIPPSGRLDTGHLIEIAGSIDHVFIANNGFDDLTPAFAREISEHMCGDPCDHVLHDHV